MRPAASDSPCRNVVARSSRLVRDEGEHLADVAEVGERVHPHQQQVVALREHVLVHLLRALRGDEQVEPELAALAGDPDGVLGRDRGERILRLRRADVVRLVDDDQDRPALLAPPPELPEHRRRGERLLLAGCERAEIDDEAAHVVLRQLRQHRRPIGAGPDTPAVEAEVPGAADQPPARAAVALQLLELLEGQRLAAVRERCQLRVLLAVADGVEAERRCLRRRVELREPQREAVVRPPHGQRACGPRVAVSVVAVGIRPQLPEPGEVGVRIEDDDLQVSVQQQLLEHDAERVGLARARLAAEEGVPPESAGIERERHAGRKQQLPDLEPGAPWSGLLEVRCAPRPASPAARRRRGTTRRRR